MVDGGENERLAPRADSLDPQGLVRGGLHGGFGLADNSGGQPTMLIDNAKI